MNIIRAWIGIGIAEGVLILVLAAIAPAFINSHVPILGFLIWIVIVGLLGYSLLHVIRRLRDATHSRRLFIRQFPDYSDLSVIHFLEYSSTRVQTTLEIWQTVHQEPEFQSLEMSPLEFLKGHQ